LFHDFDQKFSKENVSKFARIPDLSIPKIFMVLPALLEMIFIF